MADIYDQFKDFKSFEVTFYNDRNELQKIFCNVKSIENNSIVIDANNKFNNNVFAKVEDELTLYIYTENGIYSATSKVLTANKGVVSTEYIITYPANSKHSQRREYFRADLNVNFKMYVAMPHDLGSSFIIEAKTRNICGKGMSYVDDRPFPADYENITIELLFEEKYINILSKLVYSKQIVVGSRPKYIHAFTFTNISQKDVDFIVKKCFLHQLDLRKKQKVNEG